MTNIPAWKFDAVRAAILDAVADGPMLYKDLNAAVEARLDADTLERLGKLGWHVVTVKLEMEVRGDIVRTGAKGPQQIARAGQS
ncbi:DUF6958 family protein [Tateyamaria sp. SN6-1]|uniref:DUF6958 family protein n=1 Tax=Tateyamaria sp. SN6-1 TaxID=3092148 RepID=UPI0039F4AEC7